MYLRDNVRACYLKRGVEAWERQLALTWVFIGDETQPFSFDLCCRVLEADPQNVRARLQYEFYLRGYVLSEPFGLLCAPLPEFIANLAVYAAGQRGARVTAAIWRWPGVCARNLSAFLATEGEPIPDRQLVELIERLDSTGAIQDYGADCWFATGRGMWSD
ncbi:hypothetical protein BJI67_15920 (plasmid) [Acidihalobacter aeolianus]|uniref:Uncharacterized protein n=1 Tax=Acidihalobacter aeolianus TaxID=2792603 RepID=A0A1D8KCP6_9GAMM|nr:hypothetical protein BJI67_15920 [Acidihalobacter aeolianus]